MRNILCFVVIVVAASSTDIYAGEAMREMDNAFKPTCVKAVLTTNGVRPGGQIALTLRFRNEGTAPARSDHVVFVHAEHPQKSCDNIVVQADHAPIVPTSSWEPGRLIDDGTHTLDFPAAAREGLYYLHVGVYAPQQRGHPRFSDQYVAEIKVSKDAPETVETPPTMAADEVSRRRSALAARIGDALVLEDESLRFEMSRRTGTWALTDKATGETWHSNPEVGGLGDIQFTDGSRLVTRRMDLLDDIEPIGSTLVVTYTPDLEGTAPTVRVVIELLEGVRGLQFRYEAEEAEWRVESIRLLDRSVWATDTEEGYLVVPNRLGVLFPAWEGLPSITRYTAYSNHHSYSMAMFGAVKNGSALLVHWEYPYVTLEARRSWCDVPVVPGHGLVTASLVLSKSAKSFTIRPIGKGGYAEIARAYREVARERGLLRTWKDKLRDSPGVQSMFGAADFKPFVCARLLPGTRYNRGSEEIVNVPYTFEEAAQIAEHLRDDLEIDRAMFVLAGWIHRGYDNQHPDVLPAAPECGGDDGLADCARRVNSLGYLFGLHDNYQDMYRDSPSWDESFIMKHRDGSLRTGGEWLGGQAYLTCSKKAVELASREQNLPTVKKLFGPTIYFIDTTFAAPPFECFDPKHQLSLDDDIFWKRKLCEHARDTFGLFGSEEGQEWAIPCADYFEGLMSHKTQRRGKETVVPLFEMVYGDCINLYTHQGDRATPDRPGYILDHLLYAEMPVYQFGAHLYFKEEPASRVRVKPSVHSFKQTGPRTFQITYAWQVGSAPTRNAKCFVHFTSRESPNSEGIVFQNDHEFARPLSSWPPGDTVLDGPYTVEAPEDADGPFEILIGLFDSRGRVPILGLDCGGTRYHIGRLEILKDKITFDPGSEHIPNLFCFAREEGWAAHLNETDRLIKNTYEILSPLNRITCQTPMTAHEFLTSDRLVERTRFADVEITVNYGETPYRMGQAILPQYGFLVESPTFVAFHAVQYGGVQFSQPTMVTARSLDGKPLRESASVRLYRAFGDREVRIAGREFKVDTELIVGEATSPGPTAHVSHAGR